MNSKARVTSKHSSFVDDNSGLEKKSEKRPRHALGSVLEVQRFIVDVLLLHVENFGSKNCYSVPEIARTSRFADLVESR